MTTQNVTIEQFRRLEVKLQKTIENKQFSEALPIACEQEKLVKKQNLSHSKNLPDNQIEEWEKILTNHIKLINSLEAEKQKLSSLTWSNLRRLNGYANNHTNV